MIFFIHYLILSFMFYSFNLIAQPTPHQVCSFSGNLEIIEAQNREYSDDPLSQEEHNYILDESFKDKLRIYIPAKDQWVEYKPFDPQKQMATIEGHKLTIMPQDLEKSEAYLKIKNLNKLKEFLNNLPVEQMDLKSLEKKKFTGLTMQGGTAAKVVGFKDKYPILRSAQGQTRLIHLEHPLLAHGESRIEEVSYNENDKGAQLLIATKPNDANKYLQVFDRGKITHEVKLGPENRYDIENILYSKNQEKLAICSYGEDNGCLVINTKEKKSELIKNTSGRYGFSYVPQKEGGGYFAGIITDGDRVKDFFYFDLESERFIQDTQVAKSLKPLANYSQEDQKKFKCNDTTSITFGDGQRLTFVFCFGFDKRKPLIASIIVPSSIFNSTNVVNAKTSFSNISENLIFFNRAQRICAQSPLEIKCHDCDHWSQKETQLNTLQLESVGCSFPDLNSQEIKEGSLDQKRALQMMKYLSKPGNFEVNRHFDFFLSVTKAGFATSHPHVYLAMALAIELNDNFLIDNLPSSVKYGLSSIRGVEPDLSCWSEKEKNNLSKVADKKLKVLLEGTQKFTYRELEEKTRHYRKFLSPETIEKYLVKMADAVQLHFGDTQEGAKHNASIIWKFTDQAVKRLFNKPTSDLAMMSITRDENHVDFFQVKTAVAPDGRSSEEHGFKLDLEKRLPISGIPENPIQLSFELDQKPKRRVEVTLDRKSLSKPLVTQKPGPDYEALRAKKKKRGLVVINSSLSLEMQNYTFNEYVEYYTKNEDFTFSPLERRSGIVAHMEKLISTQDGVDYFIKEAHSDGDQFNLMAAPDFFVQVTGRKKTKEMEEEITIIKPDQEKAKKNVKIPNRSFGEWIQRREKSGGGELFYINSSCWSFNKALYEIPAAGSSLLLNIPTLSEATSFYNGEKDAMRILVDSFRKEKTFAEMREALERNKDYSNRRRELYIFPDEEEYKNKISRLVSTPIVISTKYFDLKDDGSYISVPD
jgi:hypothetical protein